MSQWPINKLSLRFDEENAEERLASFDGESEPFSSFEELRDLLIGPEASQLKSLEYEIGMLRDTLRSEDKMAPIVAKALASNTIYRDRIVAERLGKRLEGLSAPNREPYLSTGVKNVIAKFTGIGRTGNKPVFAAREFGLTAAIILLPMICVLSLVQVTDNFLDRQAVRAAKLQTIEVLYSLPEENRLPLAVSLFEDDYSILISGIAISPTTLVNLEEAFAGNFNRPVLLDVQVLPRLSGQQPYLESPRVALREVLAETALFFEYGTDYKMASEAAAFLDQVSNAMVMNRDFRLRVEGHSDQIGTTQENRDMSLRRAELVQRELVKRGVKIDQLVVIAKGDSERIDDSIQNGNPNRRVELHLSYANEAVPVR